MKITGLKISLWGLKITIGRERIIGFVVDHIYNSPMWEKAKLLLIERTNCNPEYAEALIQAVRETLMEEIREDNPDVVP